MHSLRGCRMRAKRHDRRQDRKRKPAKQQHRVVFCIHTLCMDSLFHFRMSYVWKICRVVDLKGDSKCRDSGCNRIRQRYIIFTQQQNKVYTSLTTYKQDSTFDTHEALQLTQTKGTTDANPASGRGQSYLFSYHRNPYLHHPKHHTLTNHNHSNSKNHPHQSSFNPVARLWVAVDDADTINLDINVTPADIVDRH